MNTGNPRELANQSVHDIGYKNKPHNCILLITTYYLLRSFYSNIIEHNNMYKETIIIQYNFSFFSLADSPPHDLQITAYK